MLEHLQGTYTLQTGTAEGAGFLPLSGVSA